VRRRERGDRFGVTIRTIGHSTRPIEDFIALLQENGVASLVDVRRFPGSRQNPQFNREALQASLDAERIAYRHAPDLGGRRGVDPESRNTAWRNSGFRGYADWMATDTFVAALETLIEDSADHATAVMCAEAVPWQCHRNLLADALVLRGISVSHILDAGQTRPHELHEAARKDERGRVIYPASGQQIELI
jgi:uncharacterized protein (DUF488 family)